MTDPTSPAPVPRDPSEVPSKTLATWIALVGGGLGLHHFYLHGPRRWVGWLYPLPALAGACGAWRMHEYGVDDHLGWLLVPWLGLAISAGMLCAIVFGLTPDAAWARRHAVVPPQPRPAEGDDDETPPPGLVKTGWAPVLGVILALALGGGVLMGTIAFSVQKIFEW